MILNQMGISDSSGSSQKICRTKLQEAHDSINSLSIVLW